MDWNNLGFNHLDTDSHIRYCWRDGSWDSGELVEDPHYPIHIAATALHYGQAAFEGLKAFHCRDGKVRLFRPVMNARRMARTARRVCMPEIPEALFLEAISRVVNANADYIPPYGTGGSLYVRPLLFGSGPRIGVRPAEEYIFLVLVVPVGPYYTAGLGPVRAVILDEYDRAAPQGVGHVKVAGNYAASLEPHFVAADKGFAVELYLDAAEHKYVEEFGTSNFVGITKDNKYITPKSGSILPSVTNNSLQQIAGSIGMQVECRPVAYEEIADLAEVGACGTAVVITPVNEIVRGDTSIRVGPATGCGPILQQLYERVTAIQFGEEPDRYGWTVEIS